MKWHRAIALVALAVFAQTCESDCSGKDAEDWEEAGREQAAEDLGADTATNRPDGGPEQLADDPSTDTAEQAGDSAFVPMADDLIVRLEYGDAMDGPGWYQVTMVDVDNLFESVCNTTMETTSEGGLSAFGSDDYTCMASVFNANSEERNDPHEFILTITSSLGYEREYLLTWDGGSFTNEVGNVITYSVP